MEEDLWIPIVFMIVAGICTYAFLHFNHKNRNAIMETVQKAMDTGSDLTPDLLARVGAAINSKTRDMRRGIVLLFIGLAGLMCSLFFSDPDIVAGVRAGSVFPFMMGLGFLLVWKLNKD